MGIQNPSDIKGENDHLVTIFWAFPTIRAPIIVSYLPSFMSLFACDLANEIWDFLPTLENNTLSTTNPPSNPPSSSSTSILDLRR